MAKSPFEADLLAATELARAALLEITEASTVGDCIGHEVLDEGVGTLYFACTLKGYPGWRWAASLAKVSADDPVTVLEVELLPGEGALLPPDWVPWSVRLAQYQESQALLEAEIAAAALAAEEDLDDLDDDLDEDDLDDDDLDDEILDNDFSDFDDEIDGVDIDALADESEEISDDLDDDDLDDEIDDDDLDDERHEDADDDAEGSDGDDDDGNVR